MAENDDIPADQLPVAQAGERYPWHAATWSAMARDLGRLPHALLLHGPEGLGKRAFAWRLAHALLCAAPEADGGCGKCPSCQRFAAGTHPDLLYVHPLEDSQSITIDQIREMREFVALRPHTAAQKLVVLEPAELMNLNAANALLKVLEEPPPGSLLLLVTPRIARLAATIRSRCALIAFRPVAAAEGLDWLRNQGVAEAENLLRVAGGAPLRALELARSADLEQRTQVLKDLEELRSGAVDPIRCAARWKDYGAEKTLEWMQQYLADLTRGRMAGQSPAAEKFSIPLKDLFRFSDVVSEAKSLAAGPLDAALLLEDVLIRWTRLSRSHGLN